MKYLRQQLAFGGVLAAIAFGGARAVVTAWALDNPPDYMVADLSDASGTRYYPDADFLPGGLLANEDYRKKKFVLRGTGPRFQPGIRKKHA